MSDHIEKAIADLQAEVRRYEEKAAAAKAAVNSLCEVADRDVIYATTAPINAESSRSFRSDQFYGRALATVLREVLTARKADDVGPASVNGLYEALVSGGYKFRTANAKNAKRGLHISLSKNAQVFHKLPNGKWGLLNWYPNARAPKGAEAARDQEDTDDAGEEAGDKE